MAVDCHVKPNDGYLTAELVGELDLAAVPDVRLRLLKCLAEQPPALLVDLSGMRVRQPSALNVFAATARQAARWPGTPMLICAPPPELHGAAAGLYRRALVFPTAAEARAHVAAGGAGVPPTVTEELLPVRGASRRGRDVVTDICIQWDLPHLVAPASLIASELIANVSDHVGSMMTLRLTRTRRYLLLSVRDGSTDPPLPGTEDRPARGHGLRIVEATASSWGWTPADGGKVVWASLRLDEP